MYIIEKNDMKNYLHLVVAVVAPLAAAAAAVTKLKQSSMFWCADRNEVDGSTCGVG